jgi:serine/threonine-protein kinase HipA
MSNCLYCYASLAANEQDFHASCSKKIFGTKIPPELPYSEDDLEPLAKEVIQRQTAVTGVQAKLSLHITGTNKEGTDRRFTVVGLWGGYILKPPTALYPELPEVEDVTMHLAEAVKIRTAPHSLVRMKSGNLAYLTKRMDRTQKGKLAMEDFCQLTERQTADKYHGSYEQIGKTILIHSATPGLDVVNFFELVLFSFLTGNADMHLKNFSLLEQPGQGMTLSPAYDLLNTALVNPTDTEEVALTLNGRKKKLKKSDFQAAMNTLKVDEKQQENIFNKMSNAFPRWLEIIDRSFLSDAFKVQYTSILTERMRRINQ